MGKHLLILRLFPFVNKMADVSHQYRPVDVRVIHDKVSSWEAKVDPTAPLSTKQRDAIHELSIIASRRPVPNNVSRKANENEVDDRSL